jgi:DNA (cytosine-5)-methyltransferase 1
MVASGRSERNLEVETVVECHSVSTPRTVRWAIEDLLQRGAASTFDRASTPSTDNARRIRLLVENDWDNLPNEHRPDCHRLPKVGAAGETREHSYKSMYGRLRWDDPAQTVTSGYGSMGQGRYVHPSEPRTLTPHEAARLQFFPDFFAFSAARRRKDWATMIGNAAPMKLSYAFVMEMLR